MRDYLIESGHRDRDGERLAKELMLYNAGGGNFYEKYMLLRKAVREFAEKNQDIDLGRDIERLVGLVRE